MIKIAPSILSADFTDLYHEINDCLSAKADYIHYDVMDGIFVPNISFGIPVLKSLTRKIDCFMDVHLMIDRPVRYIDDFIKAGANQITFHIESDNEENICKALKILKENRIRAGLSVKPGTSIEEVYPYIDQLDNILIMTVEPGFGGQSFMNEMLPKIKKCREYLNSNNISCDIEVDGGINKETSKLVIEAGANVLVAGSSVFKQKNRNKAIAELRI